jgi:hypothetical protein
MCWAGVVAAALMFPLVGERFVGLVAEDLAEVGDGFSRLWTTPDRHAVVGLAYIPSAFLSEASAARLSRSQNSGVSELSEPEGGHPA